MFDNIYENETVLVTGHTGFKGSWLSLWLHKLGAKVIGCALDPPTSPSNFELSGIEGLLHEHLVSDIRDQESINDLVQRHQPKFIFHLAAQPLVRESYECPRETFDVNVIGTACVLDAVRAAEVSANVVVVTSDKCYDNKEHVWGYRESDAMGGHDPYSASKGCAELLTASYRRSFFEPDKIADHGVCLATARAGNVIGGGDWAKDRIVTDIVAAISGGHSVDIRNPHAVRPWQHVLEPLSGYLTLASRMQKDRSGYWSDGWNFGPSEGSTISVGELCQLAIEAWGSGQWNDLSSGEHLHEANTLRLCIDKATSELNWRPRWSVAECLQRTMDWYRGVDGGKSMRSACLKDIADYETAMSGRLNSVWRSAA